jgi:hypothetical protein
VAILFHGGGALLSVWYKISPPVGTYTVQVTGIGAMNLLGKSVDFSGLDLASLLHDIDSNANSGASGLFSTTTTRVTDGVLIDFIGTGGGTPPSVATTNPAQVAAGAGVANGNAGIAASTANDGTVMAWNLGFTGAVQIVWSLKPAPEVNRAAAQ